MKLSERQKMCTTCEGRIPLDANLCPYCGAEQGTSGQIYLQHKSIQESLTSLYPPPYSAKNANSMKEHPIKMSPPESEKKFHPKSLTTNPSIPIDNADEQNAIEEKTSFWPLLLLSIGANMLLLGLLQLFFSDNGFLTLQWDSQYWFIYCLVALPLLYLGFKKVNSV